jgi:GH35 family endo-1,4-beta-xylanase
VTHPVRTGLAVTAAVIAAAAPRMARQDATLKDLMPKGMVIGVAINQRQSDNVDAAAVVNEAIDEDGSLRKTSWRDGIGDDYVAKAFEFAREGRSERRALLQRLQRYAEIFGLMVKHRNRVSRVTFWGLSDADSWLNRGRMNHPLLWDRQRQPKPAFHAVVDVLKRAR